MKKSQVDAMDQSVSSTDSTPGAREVNSTPSRRKSVLHTETCETRADETNESPTEKKASPKKVAGKKTSKSKIKSVPEPVDSKMSVDEPSTQAISIPDDELDNSSNLQETIADPFPNESQFNATDDAGRNVSSDESPSSDRFFCSDEKFEKFFRDKFGEDVDDDFDDDFDEDFLPLDDMEFNETLDEAYDEGDDGLDYSDDELDPDSASSDDDDFDKFDSDENFIEDSDDDYQTL